MLGYFLDLFMFHNMKHSNKESKMIYIFLKKE